MGSFRLAKRAAMLAVATSLLVACGGGGAPSLPSGTLSRPDVAPPSPTATIPSPTRSPTQPPTPTETAGPPSPTRTLTQPETPTQTVTTSASPARTTTASAVTTPTSSGTASSAAGSTADTTNGVAWWWWLLAAVLIAGAVLVPLLRRRRRRRAWQADLEAAEGDVAWFARVLIPELRQAASLEQVVGGWAVSSNRISMLDDRLTAIEATATDDAGSTRARTLRDAVRASRNRLNVLIAAGDVDTLRRDLDTAAADLEMALSSRA